MNKAKLLSAIVLGATLSVPALAQTTLKKVQDTGEITMGVRESSSPLSFTLGNGQYAGYHVDVCLAIIDNIIIVQQQSSDVVFGDHPAVCGQGGVSHATVSVVGDGE